MKQHQVPVGDYKNGNIPNGLTDIIEQIIPDGMSVFAIDAYKTDGGYLFIATDDVKNLKNYLIGFSLNPAWALIQFVTINDIWNQIQDEEKLPVSITFEQLRGLLIAS